MDENYYPQQKIKPTHKIVGKIEKINKSKIPQSIGILFIRWNFYNRVCVGVAYFENGKMVFMKLDKLKIIKIYHNFMPKEVIADFVSDYPVAMKKQNISEIAWNHMAIQQNGILEIHGTNPVASKMDRKQFNKYAKIYLE